MNRIVFVFFLCLTGLASAGPIPFHDDPQITHFVQPADLRSDWGYGPRENWYNGLIIQAVEDQWADRERPLSPKVFKALVAVESAFQSRAVSRTGAGGLVQLTKDTARRFALSLYPVDQRMDPQVALPTGVAVLAEKHRVILEPDNYYGIVLGNNQRQCPFGLKVHQAWTKLGYPDHDDQTRLDLAAFNGGGGTVMRAMARAYDAGYDPRDWDQLVGASMTSSPLYYACRQIYGHGAARKYREMADYPTKILRLADSL